MDTRGTTSRARWRLGALVLAAALVAAACTSSDGAGDGGDEGGAGGPDAGETAAGEATTSTTPAWTFPGEEWTEADPGEAGFDPAALDALAADAEAGGSSCLVVTKDGELVEEHYWQGFEPDTTREAFSATKSITSFLVGIAQDEGTLALDDPAATWIPEWEGTDADAVTVEHLVSNDSGRHWDFMTDYREMAGRAHDKTQFAVDLGQDAPPGEVWAYNNSAIQTLDAVLEAATGEDPATYAEEVLFDPIGMDDTSINHDGAGNTLTFMGAQTTCRDLARFGYLALRGGQWDGEQVVSSDYVEAATGAPSTDINAAYGYLWWLNRRGPLANPTIAVTAEQSGSTPDGQMAPGVPEDVYWALGLGGQIVAVVPSEGIVAVRMGDPPPGDAPFSHADLTAGVLGALEG